jgi:glycosyltransferase involved in cell wall biosynthesis
VWDTRIFSVFFHPDSRFTAVGGAEKRFIETLKVWSEERVNVTIIDSNRKPVSKNYVGYKVIEMPSSVPSSAKHLFFSYFLWVLWIVKACFRCPSLMKSSVYDAILAPNNTLPNIVVAYFLHAVSKVPLCVVVHHMDFPYVDIRAEPAAIYAVYRKARFSIPVALAKTLAFLIVLVLLRRSTVCIAVSNYTAGLLQKNGVSPSKIHVSGNGVDVDLIERFEAPEKLYDGIFVGRVSREKGVFDLVEIWKHIVMNNPESRLLIVGTGPDSSKMKELVETVHVSQIVLKGSCTDSEMYSLMKASKTFLFPSMFEGWGLAVGEALACGLPIVCYDIPALREIFGGCESVFFVPVGDIEMFAEDVEKILQDGDFDELGRTSKKYAKRFAWERVALEDLQIIRNLICLRQH